MCKLYLCETPIRHVFAYIRLKQMYPLYVCRTIVMHVGFQSGFGPVHITSINYLCSLQLPYHLNNGCISLYHLYSIIMPLYLAPVIVVRDVM